MPYEDPFANNPFQLPTEKEVFQMTKEAKQKKLEERERQRQPTTFETIETMTENFSETCRSASESAAPAGKAGRDALMAPAHW